MALMKMANVMCQWNSNSRKITALRCKSEQTEPRLAFASYIKSLYRGQVIIRVYLDSFSSSQKWSHVHYCLILTCKRVKSQPSLGKAVAPMVLKTCCCAFFTIKESFGFGPAFLSCWQLFMPCVLMRVPSPGLACLFWIYMLPEGQLIVL